jgi:hypothetical protein
MKCFNCKKECSMTVRNNKGKLMNCCKECKDELNKGKMKLWVSVCYKGE